MSNFAQTAVTSLIGETFTIDASAESSSHGLTVVTTSALTDMAHLDIIGGVGNDLIELTSEHFQGHDTINGSAGTNTIQLIDAASAFTDADFTNIRNIQDVTFAAGTINSGTLGENAALETFAGNLELDGHNALELNVDASGITRTLPGGSLTILGGSSSNTIIGGAGTETLTGGIGIDHITGGTGTDTISGVAGNDVLTAGTGADTFVFANQGSANLADIFSFNSANDKIDISALLGSNASSVNSGNLASYVDLKISGSDVLLSVDTTGHGQFGSANEVALLMGAASNQHIVDVVFSSLDHQVQVHA
jgi:Ca2+-binding RTX toxin-like protein